MTNQRSVYLNGNLGDGLDAYGWVIPLGSLPWQHHAIGAVQDIVGNIDNLSPARKIFDKTWGEKMLTEFTFSQWWLLAWWAWASWPWTRASGWARRRACQTYCTWLEVSVWFLIPCWFSILEIIQISLLSLWQYLHLLPSLNSPQTLCTCIWWTRHEHNVWFAFSFWLVDGPELESSIRERLEIILEVYVLKQLLMINSLSKNTLGRFQNNTYIEDVSNLIMALCVFCADTCRVTPNSRAQWIHSQIDDDKCVYFKE